MSVRIGMGQMLVEGGEPDANLSRAVSMIEEAGRRGCDGPGWRAQHEDANE